MMVDGYRGTTTGTVSGRLGDQVEVEVVQVLVRHAPRDPRRACSGVSRCALSGNGNHDPRKAPPGDNQGSARTRTPGPSIRNPA